MQLLAPAHTEVPEGDGHTDWDSEAGEKEGAWSANADPKQPALMGESTLKDVLDGSTVLQHYSVYFVYPISTSARGGNYYVP